jgi:hypothetical protein
MQISDDKQGAIDVKVPAIQHIQVLRLDFKK